MSKKYGECGKHPGQNMVNCVYCGMEEDNSEEIKQAIKGASDRIVKLLKPTYKAKDGSIKQGVEFQDGYFALKSDMFNESQKTPPQQNAEEYMKSIGIEVDKIKGLLIPITAKENESEISLIELMENYTQSVGVSEEEWAIEFSEWIIVSCYEPIDIGKWQRFYTDECLKEAEYSEEIEIDKKVYTTKDLYLKFIKDTDYIESLGLSQPQPKEEEKCKHPEYSILGCPFEGRDCIVCEYKGLFNQTVSQRRRIFD
jgi:hypothetical protein